MALAPECGCRLTCSAPKSSLAARDADLLGPVDDLAAAVVAPSGIALGVLVRQRAAQRGEHRRAGEVLAGDQLQAAAQPVQLVEDDAGDVGVEGGQGVEVRAPVGVVRGAHLRRTPDESVRAPAMPGLGRRGGRPHGIALQSVSSGTTSRRRSTAIAPTRSTRGVGPVQSTIVLAAEPARGPPSRTTAACVPSCSTASCAVVAAGRPERLALETASGPVRRSRSRATSSSGSRTATVPSASPRSQARDGACSSDQREPARPERLGEPVRATGGRLHHEPGQRRRLPDEHRHRHRPAAVLGGQQPGHRGGGEGVGRDAVDGVGGQQHQLAAADRGRGGVEAGGALRRGRSSRRGQPRGSSLPHSRLSARRAVVNRGPPGEVGVVLDVGEGAVRAHQRGQRARPAGRRARCPASHRGAAAARR